VVARVRDIAGYSGARLIGEGGFGAVYRARDETHGRDVAIKVLPSELGDDERRRFERERQTMGLLGAHPFVVQVFESGFTDDGEAYIVMEFASGGSMGERVRSTGPVPWAEAAKVMAAMADAVQIAHENGVLHRDIKPDNVLIDGFGNPKLADFGIAAVAGSTTSTTNTLTTVAHAAPELMQGEPSSEAVDIYALGSSAYALIKGTPAFYRPDDDDMTPMVGRIQNDAPPDLRKFGIPDDVVKVIEQAMAKDPADRYTSATALAQDLRAASAGEGPPTGPLTIAPDDLPTIAAQTAADRDASTNGASSNGTSNRSAAGVKAGATAGAAASAVGKAGDEDGAVETADKTDTEAPESADADNDASRNGDDGDSDEGGGDDTSADDDSGGESGSDDGGEEGGESSSDETDPSLSTGVHKPGSPPLPPHQYESVAEPEPTWSAGRIAALGIAVAAFIAAVALAVVLIGAEDEAIDAGDGSAATALTVVGNGEPAVQVDCPSVIPVGAKVFCSIFTTNAVSGQWRLPAFLDGPQPIEIVPGEYEIFIAPTNPEAVGEKFTMIVDVEGTDGSSAQLVHDFSVVELYAEVSCPLQIPLNQSVVCDITSYNATEGEWSIPRFGGSGLEVVPGSNPIFIEPSDPDSVGSRYEITVVVRDGDGQSYTAMSEFEVVPAG